MYLLKRAALVVGGIFVGVNLLNHFVLGRIVDSINRYFAKFDEMMEIAKRYGDAEISTVKNLWDSPRNRAINAALIRDTSSGRLIRADFGWTMPTAMKSMLDQYKGTPDNCPKA
jgi:hypothetical protein